MPDPKTDKFWNDCFSQSSNNYKSLAQVDFSTTINRLRQYRVNKVLDLGCGYGHWSVALAKDGFQMTAVDLSSTATKIVGDWAKKENLCIPVVTCLAQDLDLPEASFDAVICNSVLDHLRIEDARTAVENVKNVLKPAGVAYASFDGFEDEDQYEHETFDDGAWRFTKGKFAGMIWRYYSDQEIYDLCHRFKIVEFTVAKNGRRFVWLLKQTD